ncbi:hypothetical protein LCM4579_22930 [Ensifer sp. LCM 4579]|nr:hypothetical protein LCM4579_22930 [Ensifer sp. LCM 4579]
MLKAAAHARAALTGAMKRPVTEVVMHHVLGHQSAKFPILLRHHKTIDPGIRYIRSCRSIEINFL